MQTLAEISRAVMHYHPSFQESCKSLDGIQATNAKHVSCPDCLNAIARTELVESHAAAMLTVLRLSKNAAKGHWRDIPVYDLLRLAEREFSELTAAVWTYNCRTNPTEEHRARVVSEAADLSAFAAMIADNVKRGRP